MSALSTHIGDASALLVERGEGIVILSLNRPSRRNAIDEPTAKLISAALDEFDTDDELRVAVLTGTPDVFSAGMDLKAFADTGQRPIDERRGGFGIVATPPNKPIIAAVEGPALGGGFEIALACDLIVAGDSASFGLPEVKRGLVASGGGMLRLPRRIPHNLAMEIVLSGRSLSAARGAELGLVNSVVPDGGALTEARSLAAEIAQNAPLALRASKEVLAKSRSWRDEEQFALQEALVDPVRRSQDAKEGARAFTEKRAPQWQAK